MRSGPSSSMVLIVCVLCAVLLSAALIAVCLNQSQPGDADRPGFVIVHTGDTHGYIGNDGSLGLSTVKALRESYEAKGNIVFTVDAGDFYSGNAYTIMDHDFVIDPINKVGYDVMTLGNHEFDNGIYEFKAVMDKLGCPVICSNLVDENGDSLFEEYVIIEKQGLRLGFFGLITPSLDNILVEAQLCGTRVTDPVEAAERMVSVLKKEGVDAVILLSHLGVGEPGIVTSDHVCRMVSGIDLCVNGHSHTPMEHGKCLDPSIVLEESDTWLCDAGEYLETIGIVTKDSHGFDSILYSDSPIPDPVVDKAVDESYERVVEKGRTYLTTSEVFLDSYFGTTHEHSLSKLTTNFYQTLADTDFCLINLGSFIQPVNEGEVTYKDALDAIPYANFVYRFHLTGSEMLALTERICLSDNVYPYNFLEFSDNVAVLWDPSAEEGQRIVSFTVHGEKLDPERTYHVCTTLYTMRNVLGLSDDHLDEYVGTQVENTIYSFTLWDPITLDVLGPNRYTVV